MHSLTITAKIRFRRTDEGGFKGAFRCYDFFTGKQFQLEYPMHIGEGCFDFRIFNPPVFIRLGKEYDMELKFLSPELVAPLLAVGGKFTFGLVRPIGDGVVKSVKYETHTETVRTDEDLQHNCELWKPDFFLLTAGLMNDVRPIPCFFNYVACPQGRDCVFSACADVGGQNDESDIAQKNIHELMLYCSSDILNSELQWPRLCTLIQCEVNAKGSLSKITAQRNAMLFPDLESAIDFQREVSSLPDDRQFDSKLTGTRAFEILKGAGLMEQFRCGTDIPLN